MNKKWLFGIILVLTIVAIIIILILKSNVSYNKLIISKNKWISIISNRENSTNISFEDIEFNDYNLLIDNENDVIYYSVVDLNKKYNPSIKYTTNKKVSVVVNDKITGEKLEQTGILKIMLYNDKEYRIYSLVVTNFSTLNIIYDEKQLNNTKILSQIELFDNHEHVPQRVLKSDGIFKIIEDNNLYSFSLTKNSPGNNRRENHVSIFGMEKRDEYLIKKTSEINNNERHIKLFVNNKYIGLYSLGPKDGRRINNFERNKENNR